MNATPTGSDKPNLMARLDWASGPLGAAQTWPQSLRTAVDMVLHCPLPMALLWGPQLVHVYNDAFARLAGDKHPRAFAQPTHTAWPELRSVTEPIYQRVLQGQTHRCRDQLWRLPFAGRLCDVWLDLTYGPVHDESGHVAGILVTAIETSERRRMALEFERRSEASLKAQQESEERLQLALAAAEALGTWDWDISEDRFIADEHFALLHGVEPRLSRQLPISAYLEGVHPEDRAMVTRSIKHCITHGTEYAEEYRLLHADGELRWVFVRGRCYKDRHGRPKRFLGAALDLTERKRTEEALRNLNETLEERVIARTRQLAEANHRLQNEMIERERAEEALRHAQKMEAVGQLTGGIAHDFNNMLTGILGSLELMQRYIADGRIDEIGRFTEAAVSSANRAASLTHRLLAFSRRQSLDRKPLDANALVRSLEDLLSRTTGDHIALRLQLADELWPVSTDASQLENALLNLVINARDAMPDGGELSVETANIYLDGNDLSNLEPVKAGDYVMIAVRDNGSGMTPSVLAKAFDPFFTTKPIGQGTGLGLSMIYGFAQQSGGHLSLDSVPGQGTRVQLYLPRLHVTPAEEPVSPTAVDAPPAIAGETVLLVEDEPAVRMLVLDLLENLGYTALQAQDAKGALAQLESEQRVDLLVTDVGLPGMNGRQLAEIARQHRPGLKVLFMTGYAQKAAERQGFLEHGMDMIAKPFTLDQLANKIRAMINHDA
ncbi:response regulator [Pseudomonas citri]|uniref:response regulator n=1 Tax=Pseudomonas citri TaxID=2978349 RepID=UPI0021B60E8F|nr:response regulator [Pseudomonas citri]